MPIPPRSTITVQAAPVHGRPDALTAPIGYDRSNRPDAPTVEGILLRNLTGTGISVSVNSDRNKTEAILITRPDGAESYFRAFTVENAHIRNYAVGSKPRLDLNNAKDLTFKNIYLD